MLFYAWPLKTCYQMTCFIVSCVHFASSCKLMDYFQFQKMQLIEVISVYVNLYMPTQYSWGWLSSGHLVTNPLHCSPRNEWCLSRWIMYCRFLNFVSALFHEAPESRKISAKFNVCIWTLNVRGDTQEVKFKTANVRHTYIGKCCKNSGICSSPNSFNNLKSFIFMVCAGACHKKLDLLVSIVQCITVWFYFMCCRWNAKGFEKIWGHDDWS